MIKKPGMVQGLTLYESTEQEIYNIFCHDLEFIWQKNKSLEIYLK